MDYNNDSNYDDDEDDEDCKDSSGERMAGV